MVDRCSVVRFPSEWNLRREPKRPPELRRDYFGGMKFNDNFDWDTLWYDALQISPQTILLIGPPLYQTANLIAGNIKIVDDHGTMLSGRFIEMDRACLTVLNTTSMTSTIRMISQVETVIPVNQISNEFIGCKVMFTLQKNNPINWIKEWISYHHLNFGIEGFLIYDNQSSIYDAEQLESSVSEPGVKVKVVSWDVPYGPQGFACDYYNTWDSDYAQSTMFEHAKRKYLHGSTLAINADIDELLVLKDKTLDQIIQDINHNNISGYCYKGRWIEPYDLSSRSDARPLPLDQRHFYDYHCTDHTQPRDLGNKWMLIPKKALDGQWSVHHANCTMVQSTDIYYGHYLAMNTNWSYPRDQYDRDPSNLISDPILERNLNNLRNQS
jgi:hypothetical protein